MSPSKSNSKEKTSYHVIWKRPDGFHGAHPSDFRVVDVGHSKLWLHKKDHDEFPFKVSGGWEADESTRRLNNLLNVIDESTEGLAKYLEKTYDDRMKDNPEQFIQTKIAWIKDLKLNVKGDTWETEIMREVFDELITKIEGAATIFNRFIEARA